MTGSVEREYLAAIASGWDAVDEHLCRCVQTDRGLDDGRCVFHMRGGDNPTPEWVESWQPREGDRVVVRVTPECRYQVGYMTEDDEADEIRREGHDPAEDGQIGTVDTVEPIDFRYRHRAPFDRQHAAHRVLVLFDTPVSVGVTAYPQWVQYFAVAELELLSDADRADDDDAGEVG